MKQRVSTLEHFIVVSENKIANFRLVEKKPITLLKEDRGQENTGL